MQLRDRGLLDLDDPVGGHLGSIRLTPASGSFGPVTIRQLLTHTGGIGELRNLADLFRPTIGLAIGAGQPTPPLSAYYRAGYTSRSSRGASGRTPTMVRRTGAAGRGRVRGAVRRVHAGARARAAGHGAHRLRPHRSHHPAARHRVHAAAAGPQGGQGPDREVSRAFYPRTATGPTPRPAAGGTAEAETLAVFRRLSADPRIPGIACVSAGMSRHRTAARRGWPGFISALTGAHDGVAGCVHNTGHPCRPVSDALLRQILAAADQPQLTYPSIRRCGRLCGWYGLPRRLTNARPRMLIVPAEVFVRDGHLMLRAFTPVPPLRRGNRLHAATRRPLLLPLDLTADDLAPGRSRSATTAAARTTLHMGPAPMSLYRRPGYRKPARLAAAAAWRRRPRGRGGAGRPPPFP